MNQHFAARERALSVASDADPGGYRYLWLTARPALYGVLRAAAAVAREVSRRVGARSNNENECTADKAVLPWIYSVSFGFQVWSFLLIFCCVAAYTLSMHYVSNTGGGSGSRPPSTSSNGESVNAPS